MTNKYLEKIAEVSQEQSSGHPYLGAALGAVGLGLAGRHLAGKIGGKISNKVRMDIPDTLKSVESKHAFGTDSAKRKADEVRDYTMRHQVKADIFADSAKSGSSAGRHPDPDYVSLQTDHARMVERASLDADMAKAKYDHKSNLRDIELMSIPGREHARANDIDSLWKSRGAATGALAGGALGYHLGKSKTNV